MKRDNAIDIAKAVLIVLMMIGHMNISDTTHAVIYSFHMAAFVFYSGYCFKPTSIKNLAKTFLFPYLIGASLFVAMGDGTFGLKILDVLCGFSKANLIFPEHSTVGQVYFLLLLFLVRLTYMYMYMYMYRFVKNEILLSITIIVLSILGVVLGKTGYWMPWSLDCALFTLVFYHAGVLVKKYEILEFFIKNKWYNIILFVIWIASITQGGMSLFVRDYGNYVITVLGAISASILLYELASILNSHLKPMILHGIVNVGQQTLSILLVHTVLGGYIVVYVINGIMRTGIIESLYLNYIIILLVHIVIGLLWGKVYEKICNILF